MKKLTDVERKIFDVWARQVPGLSIESNIDYLRERAKQTAYHEAGHAAANAFFGDGFFEFKRISIIPNSNEMGSCEIDFYNFPWENMPPVIQQSAGYMKIIYHLSGRVAESRVGGDIDPIGEAAEEDAWENEGFDSEENWRKRTDAGKALTLAEIFSRPKWPPHRILNMLEGWTNEFIDLSDVWHAIESIAKKLLAEGEIADSDTYDKFVGAIVFQGQKSPGWRERLWPDEKNLSR